MEWALPWSGRPGWIPRSLTAQAEIFVLTGGVAIQPARDRMVALAGQSTWLRSAGYKVPGDQVWPAVKWVTKSDTWWQDPDAWTSGIIDMLVELWPEAASLIDESLHAGARASR